MNNNSLILYTYCENQESILKNTESSVNLKYFLENAIIDNQKYLYCININGNYSFEFKPYLKKYSNLKIFIANGKCALEGYLNILNNLEYKVFNNFFFISDKVCGPYNKNIINDWVEFYSSYIKNYKVIISSYGTSPMENFINFLI